MAEAAASKRAVAALRRRRHEEATEDGLPPSRRSDETLSSSEIESRRRAKRRRLGPRSTPDVPPAQTLAPEEECAVQTADARPASPVIEDIAELWRSFPGVRNSLPPAAVGLTNSSGVVTTAAAAVVARRPGARGASAAGTAAAAAAAANAHPRHPLHREEPDTNPYLVEEFQWLLNQLDVPEFVVLPTGPTGPRLNDQTQLSLALRATREDRRLVLPVLTAQHESELLAEAGIFPSRTKPGLRIDYPPCRRGDQCVGKTQDIEGLPTGGVVLTCLLFEEEYATLQRTGRAPVVSRSCVLCYRFHAQDYILTLRPNLKRIGGVHEGVLQIYRNLCDEPGGYFREAMLHPDPQRFDGFIDPIAIFCRSTLRAQLSLREGQRWRIEWTRAGGFNLKGRAP
jgi:hypothetical protein